jgi:hypothetical protein
MPGRSACWAAAARCCCNLSPAAEHSSNSPRPWRRALVPGPAPPRPPPAPRSPGSFAGKPANNGSMQNALPAAGCVRASHRPLKELAVQPCIQPAPAASCPHRSRPRPEALPAADDLIAQEEEARGPAAAAAAADDHHWQTPQALHPAPSTGGGGSPAAPEAAAAAAQQAQQQGGSGEAQFLAALRAWWGARGFQVPVSRDGA